MFISTILLEPQQQKRMEDMTFEEQMELAIQQSLLETDLSYHHGNESAGGVSEHMYARSGNAQNCDEDYESYDIGPGGDHGSHGNGKSSSRQVNSPSHRLKRSSSDTDLDMYRNNNEHIECFNKSVSAKLNTSRSSDDMSISEGVFSTDENEADGETGREDAANLANGTQRKKWSQRLKHLVSIVGSEPSCRDSLTEVDLMCREEMPSSDWVDREKTLGDRSKFTGKSYELSDSDVLNNDDRDNEVKTFEDIWTKKNDKSGTKGGNSLFTGGSPNGHLDHSASKRACSCERKDTSCKYCNRNRGIKRAIFSSVRKLGFEDIMEVDNEDENQDDEKSMKTEKLGKCIGKQAKVGEKVGKDTSDCRSETCSGQNNENEQDAENESGEQTNRLVNGDKKSKYVMTDEEKSFFEDEDGMYNYWFLVLIKLHGTSVFSELHPLG